MVNFRLDTSADVTVVPDRFFRKNSFIIKPTNKMLYGPGQHETKVLRHEDTTLNYGENNFATGTVRCARPCRTIIGYASSQSSQFTA